MPQRLEDFLSGAEQIQSAPAPVRLDQYLAEPASQPQADPLHQFVTQIAEPALRERARLDSNAEIARRENISGQPMAASDKAPLIKAYNESLSVPLVTDQSYGQMKGQIEQVATEHNTPIQNFGGGLGQSLAHAGTGLLGSVAPETASRLNENVQSGYATDPDSNANLYGGVAGNIAGAVPLIAAGPAGGAVLMGGQTFGNVRNEMNSRRHAGEQISTEQELTSAAIQGLISSGLSFVQIKQLANTPAGAALLQKGMSEAIQAYGYNAGMASLQGMDQQLASNIIDKLVTGKPLDESVGQGVGGAGNTGLAVGAALTPIGALIHGRQQTPQPEPTKEAPQYPTNFKDAGQLSDWYQKQFPGDEDAQFIHAQAEHSALGSGYTLRDIPLSQIKSDAPENSTRAAEYAKLPAETQPPVIVDRDNNVYAGITRTEAARLRGDETIKAYVPDRSPYTTPGAEDLVRQVRSEVERHKMLTEQGIELGNRYAPEGKAPTAESITGKPMEAKPTKLEEALVGESGAATPAALKGPLSHLIDSAKRLSGKMFPTVTRGARSSGEAAARYVASRAYAKEAAPVAAREIIGAPAPQSGMDKLLRRPGGGVEPKMDVLAGAVLVQDNLDSIRDNFVQEGDATRAAGVRDIIGGKNSPFKTRAEFDAAVKDPKVKAVVDRYKKWFAGEPEKNFRESLDVAPSTSLPSRGLQTDARVNLIADAAASSPTVVSSATRGNLTNPRERVSQFARKAFGTGTGYELRLSKMIENTLGKGTENANQHRLYDQLVKDGLAVRGAPGDKPTIGGKETVPLELKNKTLLIKGDDKTSTVAKNETLWVRSDVYPEIRQALNVDSPHQSTVLKHAADVANRSALVSLSEASYHTANQISALINTPGTGAVIPGMVKRAFDLISRDPATQRQIVDLARIGAIREQGPEATTTLQKINPTRWVGKAIEFTDRVGRLVLDDAFTKLADKKLVPNTETARRDLVNQFGQYNKRAQHKLVALARNIGFGPFATAGTNFYSLGVKAVTGSAGIEGKTFGAGVQLRGMVYARYASILGAAALANYLKWGRVDGGNNVPVGAIRLDDDKKTGKIRYFDPLSITAFKRGMRETGALAVAEGIHHGDPANKIADQAAKDVALSGLHPFEGPLVNSAAIAITGHDTHGYQVAPKAAKDESQAVENLKSAGLHFNPVVAAYADKDTDVSEQLGKFRVRSGKKEGSIAEIQARRIIAENSDTNLTAEEREKYKAKRELIDQIQKPGVNRRKLLLQAVADGQIKRGDIEKITKDANKPTGLLGMLQSPELQPDDLMYVWSKATPEEKRSIRWTVQGRVYRSTTLDADTKKQYLKQIAAEGRGK